MSSEAMEEWEKQALLDGMSFAAFQEASDRLSEEGKEVLRMLDAATTTWDIPPVDAFDEAAGVDGLSEREQMIIFAYIARESLIDSFRQEEDG
jgi:hypothetical protein